MNQEVFAYFDSPDTPQVDIVFIALPELPAATTKVTVTATGYLVNIP